MKKLPALLAMLAASAHADPQIHSGDTLAIVGDSITAQHLYSAYLEEYILMCAPPTDARVVQFGRILEKSVDFEKHMAKDALVFKPTIATISYGMNDGGYGPLSDTVASVYRDAQTNVVETMKKNGVTRILLASPKPVDPLTYKNRGTADAAEYNKTLAALAGIDQDIAAKQGIQYVDIFGVMRDAIARARAMRGDTYILGGGDGIHPDPNGHLVMTYAFLKALGYDGSIATVTVDLARQHADATPGTRVLSVAHDTVTLECTRYPFCFTGHPTDTDGNNATALPLIPFNEELNRYLLVVKGLPPGGKSKVQWGGYPAQEFSNDDLAKGVNLAAAFAYDNPFHGQFFKVDHDVLTQQAFEERLVQGIMTPQKDYTELLPAGDDSVPQFIAAGLKVDASLQQAARAAVIPITTTLKIERE
jgi:lysophospholipase L1-like esterase